jgi:hypothetical protein
LDAIASTLIKGRVVALERSVAVPEPVANAATRWRGESTSSDSQTFNIYPKLGCEEV